MSTLLVVDDEPSVLYSIKKRMERDGLTILTAETAGQGIAAVRERRPDAVVLDVRLPDMSGLDAFVRIREVDPLVPVVIITAYAATETAIEAMKRGAFDYLLKPVDFQHLCMVTDQALAAGRARHAPTGLGDEQVEAGAERIVGRSSRMQELYKTIGRVASQDVAVLITGESGTGKELVARAIYQHSRRVTKPFLAVNCAALAESLLESELFGHEHGAFTGAERRRIGKFEQVHGGTLFLDEIGDMSPRTQAKVLRVLQGGEFERLGGNETVRADVRIIAATNQNLEDMVAAGTFRRDLFYRLNGVMIGLPPLRERVEDVSLLVDHFIAVFSREFGRPACQILPEALKILEAHAWPGNVRELQNVVRYALMHARGNCITPDSLPPSVDARRRAKGPTDDQPLDVAGYVRQLLGMGEPEIYRALIDEVDRVALREVLAHVGGNQVQASELLGISRSTLRSKLAELGMLVMKPPLAERRAPEAGS